MTPFERLPDEDAEYPNAVKISQSSKISSVAGKIAHSMRAANWPTLLVAGNGSIAVAVKCCLTAARFVQPDSLVVAFSPGFRVHDHARALLALLVVPPDPPTPAGAPAPAGVAEIKVGAHSRHASAGAALSARLLEAGDSAVVLSALGETAVANAVLTAAHAAHYLATQRQLRLRVEPRAALVVKGGDQLAAVELWVTLQGGHAGIGQDAATALAALTL